MVIVNEKAQPLPSATQQSDHPPPYSSTLNPSISQAFPVAFPSLDPVNQVAIHTRSNDISGTFNIDPLLPSSHLETERKYKLKRRPPPNASFRTRRGDISLKLATTGSTADVAKATVEVASHRGDIALELLPMQISKHISLDAHSHRGNIVLFVPRGFRGAIQLRTRSGNVNFLPALSNIMSVLKTSDREALVLVGDPNSSPGVDDSAVADYCQLTSRHGKLTVGLSGEDVYIAEVGIWAKLGNYLRGGEDSENICSSPLVQ